MGFNCSRSSLQLTDSEQHCSVQKLRYWLSSRVMNWSILVLYCVMGSSGVVNSILPIGCHWSFPLVSDEHLRLLSSILEKDLEELL